MIVLNASTNGMPLLTGIYPKEGINDPHMRLNKLPKLGLPTEHYTEGAKVRTATRLKARICKSPCSALGAKWYVSSLNVKE